MANKYGTKAWTKWASDNLDFALMLLKEPEKKWDTEYTHLEMSIKSINTIKTNLEEVMKKPIKGT